jgi:hypothetical protein
MNCRTLRNRLTPRLFLTAVVSLAVPANVMPQGPPPPPGPPPTAEQAAPQDLTGYWVSVVTEDWRLRMMTPPKGDYEGVPLNPEGRRVAGTWDPAKDIANHEECKSYGAPAVMRIPERIHITWKDPNTLQLETDYGTQTRLFYFGGKPPAHEAPSWQGYSVASWQGRRPGAGAGLGARATAGREPEGYLQVNTTNLRPGYLRKNGVPYSKDAAVEEYFDSFQEPDGNTWLSVTTVVTDPTYLQAPFVVSSNFKKLPDNSGWDAAPCEAQ